MNRFSRLLGQVCDDCPLCKWSRNNPDTKLGKLMEWHGNWCPAWKAQKEIEEERKASQGNPGASSSS